MLCVYNLTLNLRYLACLRLLSDISRKRNTYNDVYSFNFLARQHCVVHRQRVKCTTSVGK